MGYRNRGTGSMLTAGDSAGRGTGTDLVTVTVPGVDNTEGAWTGLTTDQDDPPFDYLWAFTTQDSSSDRLLDLALGAPGSPTELVPDMLLDSTNSFSTARGLPLGTPAGDLSARFRAVTAAGATTRLGIRGERHRMGHKTSRGAVANTVGANPATSTGTAVDPGAVANTKGAWVQFSAATARQTKAVLITAATVAATIETHWNVDLGLGAGGSEVVILADLGITHCGSTTAVMTPPHIGPIPLTIPAGSRVALRCSCPSIVASHRVPRFVLHLFT